MHRKSIFILSLLLLAGNARAADDVKVAHAQAAAKTWLALIDAGHYAKSWDAASVFFRGSITKVTWEAAVRSVRAPLGPVTSRTLNSATFTRTLPGAPDGEYVVIQYTARFKGRAPAVETVTPMREKDGAWRVAGYFVR